MIIAISNNSYYYFSPRPSRILFLSGGTPPVPELIDPGNRWSKDDKKRFLKSITKNVGGILEKDGKYMCLGVNLSYPQIRAFTQAYVDNSVDSFIPLDAHSREQRAILQAVHNRLKPLSTRNAPRGREKGLSVVLFSLVDHRFDILWT